jgi:WD40 repeat protein
MKNFLIFLAFFSSSILLLAQPLPTGSDTLWVKQIGAEVKSVKFSPDGQFVYAAAIGNKPMKLSSADGSILKHYDSLVFSDKYMYIGFDLSKDGQYIVAGDTSNIINIWDTQTGDIVKILSFALPTDNIDLPVITDFCFSNDDTYLAMSYIYKTMRHSDIEYRSKIIIWNFVTKQIIKEIDTDYGVKVKYSPSGIYLAVCNRVQNNSDNGRIDIYNTNTWNIEKSWEHNNIVTDIAFSPDGSLLASCAWDGYIKIWDMNTLELKKSLSLGVGYIDAIEFIDNQRLLSSSVASAQSCVVIWDIETSSFIKRWEKFAGVSISQFAGKKCVLSRVSGVMCLNLDKYVNVETQPNNNITIIPNPFNQNISFNIIQENPNNIKIELFDNLSNSIAVIYDSFVSAFPFNYIYNTESLPSGIYHCKISIAGTTFTQQLIKIN